MAFEFIADAVAKRKADHLFRTRHCVNSNKNGVIEIANQHYLNFASNDYLGLSQHEHVLQAFAEGLSLYGAGGSASSVVTGYTQEHQALEDDICAMLNKPAALLFSSGFSANQAICHALFGSNNANGRIICDKYMHASFIQGALETQAPLKRYKHNDMQHLRKLLNDLPAHSLLATEGVFSMDGDIGDVHRIHKELHDAQGNHHQPWVMLDEAHAIGVLGERGFGSLDLPSQDKHYVNSDNVDVVMGTFGKAVGTGGAFVAGPQVFIDYLVNYAKHYVYSTAFSAAQARATRASLALIEAGEQRNTLHQNIALFRHLAKQKKLPILASLSAIQPIIVGAPERAVAMSKRLADLGLWVPAIRTPTVPKHTDRLRITLSAMHSRKDITALVDALDMVFQA